MNLPDLSGVFSIRGLVHGVQDGMRVLRGDYGEQLAFIGDVERIKPQKLAGSLDSRFDGKGGFIQGDPNLGLFGDLVQGRSDSSPRWIA